jgi:hypothetical protein
MKRSFYTTQPLEPLRTATVASDQIALADNLTSDAGTLAARGAVKRVPKQPVSAQPMQQEPLGMRVQLGKRAQLA